MAEYLEEGLELPLRSVLAKMQQGIIQETTYFGVRTYKSPIDAWVYQEIIFATKPDVVVEIGNRAGGSTLFLAHLCTLLGRGRVIGVDLSHQAVPDDVRNHPSISLIEGDACDSIDQVEAMLAPEERVLVIEDSSHTHANTLRVLRAYSKLVKPGDYFIVEDSIVQHGLDGGPFPGAWEAIEDFVSQNEDFEIDRTREHFFVTWNPKGYLRRKPENDEPVVRRGGISARRARLRELARPFVPPIVFQLLERRRRTDRR